MYSIKEVCRGTTSVFYFSPASLRTMASDRSVCTRRCSCV